VIYQGKDGKEEPAEIIPPPLFTTEFILTIENLTFRPNEDIFQDRITYIIECFQGTVLEVKNLVPDSYFDAFTKLVE
jgi:dynein heavy chain